MTDKINIAFSPCPNDTFMMAGLVSGKVGVEGFTFIPHLADIEELNNLAQEGQMDVLKMSVNAYPMASINYQMLRVGAALGTNNGPVVVCKPGDEGKIADTQARIAVPGMHTTANLLMTIFYPELTDKTGVLFSEIEKNVLNGNFDIGVLIHENRLTYAEKGLVKIADLGVLWKEHNDCALPLGCFAVKRRLQLDYKRAIEEAIRKSIIYGYEHLDEVMPYIRQHAQNMSDDVILEHIRTYVNHFSVNLGNEGTSAIRAIFRRAKHASMYNLLTEPIFID